jgi:phosphatidylglycerophosphate synthase
MPSLWITVGPLLVFNTYFIVMLVAFYFVNQRRPKTIYLNNRHTSVILNRWIREYWMWVTEPFLKICLKLKIKPNTISFMGTCMALLSGTAFACGNLGLGGWLMVFGASLDFFDGRVARETGQTSEAGAFFDSSMDRISEGLTTTGIAYLYKDSFIFWVVMAMYLGSMLTSYTKAKGETMGVDYSGGMMQRPERIVYTGVGGILSPVIAYFTLPLFLGKYPELTQGLLEDYIYLIPLIFVAVMTNVTTLNRIVNIMQLLNGKTKTGTACRAPTKTP